MQINLTGFLNGKNARSFMGELWDLLVSAQESVTGIPEAFLQQKKDQIKKRLVGIAKSTLIKETINIFCLHFSFGVFSGGAGETPGIDRREREGEGEG